jgi:hypothetical protein
MLVLLFVVYCHETGLKLNPKLSSEKWWRVVWSFLQSLWRSEKEIRELKREIEYVLKYIRSDKYNTYIFCGICVIAIHMGYYCSLRKFLTMYGTKRYWWPTNPSVSIKEAARPRILYLEFLLKNVHLVHELLKLNEKISNDESLSVSEVDRERHQFLYYFLHPSRIK